MRLTTIVRIIAITALTGCGRGAERQAPDSTTAPPPTAGAPPATDVAKLFAGMRTHLDSLDKLTAEQLPSALKGHDSLVIRTIKAIDQEMEDMGMKGGSRAWDALIDSVKTDAAELPKLAGPDLAAREKQHARRVRDMMEGHERMMETMH
jgi:hypothetical protein